MNPEAKRVLARFNYLAEGWVWLLGSGDPLPVTVRRAIMQALIQWRQEEETGSYKPPTPMRARPGKPTPKPTAPQ